ncbi:MAG: MaoC/PaaZ C-terminal domain-containing protein [bacterium]
MKKNLISYKDIATIPEGYVYKSPKIKSRYLWTLFFGFLTGDLNPVHINIFTYKKYKSKLGGLSRHGISTIAQAESFIFKIFTFIEPTEIIAQGYNVIRYLAPIHIGDTIEYSYTLVSKKISEEKESAKCTWLIVGTNQIGKQVFTCEWVVLYYKIERV